jgi:hypothetical protein
LQIGNPRLEVHDLAIEGMSIAPTSQVMFKGLIHQEEDSIEVMHISLPLGNHVGPNVMRSLNIC